EVLTQARDRAADREQDVDDAGDQRTEDEREKEFGRQAVSRQAAGADKQRYEGRDDDPRNDAAADDDLQGQSALVANHAADQLGDAAPNHRPDEKGEEKPQEWRDKTSDDSAHERRHKSQPILKRRQVRQRVFADLRTLFAA